MIFVWDYLKNTAFCLVERELRSNRVTRISKKKLDALSNHPRVVKIAKMLLSGKQHIFMGTQFLTVTFREMTSTLNTG